MHYRQDIDGFRALAVSLVVIFHTNEALIPGGFIGVDIFFVISGYLITGLILRDIDAGQFSFVEFYRRRTKRILPAMFLVTFSTLCVGAWLMLPSDVLDLSQSAIATAVMLSNAYFTFELDTGYFAADSRTIPLLHMWSLAVEEQFYLFWPILLVVLAKTRLNLLPILVGLVLVSVTVGEWMLREGWHSFAYYMLPSRVFQFALGGALVLVERKGWATLGSAWAFWVSLAGLLLVVASAFGLDGETAFPGLWAVPVTVGATLLLWGGRAPHALSKLFSLAPLRWIGLVSFSLYLWHWPVLAFQRYLYPELGVAQQVLSIAVMLGLSVLSYRLIEQPFRLHNVTAKAAIVRYWVVPGLVVMAIAGLHTTTKGYGLYSFTDLALKLDQQSTPAFRLPFTCQRPVLTEEVLTREACVLGPGEAPDVLLWGDSNAAQFVVAFDAISQELNFRFRNIAHSACPPAVSKASTFTGPKYVESCAQSHINLQDHLGRYDTLILAASWDSYVNRKGVEFEAAVSQAVEGLVQAGKRLVLIGVVPRQKAYDRSCEAKRLKHSWVNCGDAPARAAPPDINSVLQDLAEQYPAVWYLDPYPVLCDGSSCPISSGGQSLYYDAGHISVFGSKQVGAGWLEDSESRKTLEAVFGG